VSKLTCQRRTKSRTNTRDDRYLRIESTHVSKMRRLKASFVTPESLNLPKDFVDEGPDHDLTLLPRCQRGIAVDPGNRIATVASGVPGQPSSRRGMKILYRLVHINEGRRNKQHHGGLNFISVRSALLLLHYRLDAIGELENVGEPEVNSAGGKHICGQFQWPHCRQTGI